MKSAQSSNQIKEIRLKGISPFFIFTPLMFRSHISFIRPSTDLHSSPEGGGNAPMSWFADRLENPEKKKRKDDKPT